MGAAGRGLKAIPLAAGRTRFTNVQRSLMVAVAPSGLPVVHA